MRHHGLSHGTQTNEANGAEVLRFGHALLYRENLDDLADSGREILPNLVVIEEIFGHNLARRISYHIGKYTVER